ncbi:MAG: carbohydrate porin [Bradymonadaceae bacterium]
MARTSTFVSLAIIAVASCAIRSTARASGPEGDRTSSSSGAPRASGGDGSGGSEDTEGGLESEFSFGSYGRVQFDVDEKGNRGKNTNVVAHGPRILEGSYAELDFRYTLRDSDGFGARVLFTLALQAPFAHFSGEFDGQPVAVRNLYAETWGFVPALEGLELWAGSRMYRGDDVYLLDWWPLDELNTVGGGLVWRGGGWNVRAHVGVNRIEDGFQVQTIEVPAGGHGTREKRVLDRQRTIASARVRRRLEFADGLGLKAVAYAEYHALPSGERVPDELIRDGAPVYREELTRGKLPAERGWTLGGQVGVDGFGRSGHANLFARYSRGLAAWGEFGVPVDRAADGTASRAEEWVGALSANWESESFGLMAGGYLRRFTDGDRRRVDRDDFAEGVAVVRPLVFLTDHFHQGFELSYQAHFPFGLEPETGRHGVPKVFQASVLEIVSLDRGSYSRPQIRLNYTLSLSNGAARRRYPEGDARRPEPIEHFIGLKAEWWFNSSRY